MNFIKKLSDIIEERIIPAPEEGKTSGMLYSPANGNAFDLGMVSGREHFFEGEAEAVAVIPTKGIVTSPCDGEVSEVFPQNNAISIKSDDGAGIIIHVGDASQHIPENIFKRFVENGERIRAGQLLLSFDMEKFTENGCKNVIPMVLINSKEYSSVHTGRLGDVVNTDCVLTYER